MTNKGKVWIGLSGGVDSSVSAALLKKAGYDVTGVFIKVWQPDWLDCNWRQDRLDAMRVCAKLEIPFLTLDLEKEYKKEVVDEMIREYKAGRTPNPDVCCNRYVKFGGFLEKALANGADFVATGHYAQNIFRNGHYELTKSVDQEKDQTYFLWTLDQEQLKHILFPVGHLTKPEVRKLAKKFGLATAEKKDSQGLCFIGKVDMKEFLSHYIQQTPGQVLNEQGKVIGTHEGAVFYTLGQRHGFTIVNKTDHDGRLFVSAKDLKLNTITVSSKSPDSSTLQTKIVKIQDVRWTLGKAPSLNGTYQARIRYREPLATCEIRFLAGVYELHFDSPRITPSPGQSVVIYQDGISLGGGIIV